MAHTKTSGEAHVSVPDAVLFPCLCEKLVGVCIGVEFTCGSPSVDVCPAAVCR